MAVPTAPDYENVRWPGSGGLRVPTEVAPATLLAGKRITLDLTGAISPILLNPQQLGNYFTLKNAAGAVTVSFPYGSSSKQIIVANHSGQTITFNIAAGNGVAASTGVAVTTAFRQILVIDSEIGDVRPAAAAIAY